MIGGDLGVIGAGQAEQTDLLQPGRLDAALHHRPDGLDAALPHRSGDHARLAEPAAAGAAPEDLHRVALVHGLGQRHQRLLRVRPRVQVHHRVLDHPGRHTRSVRRHRRQRPVGSVRDVVELGHVDAAGLGQAQQQPVATAGSSLALPLPDHRGDGQGDLLAVAQHGGVDEVRDRLGVERGVPTGQHDRLVLATIDRVQGHPGQIQRVQQVGVAELGGEADPEHVEVGHRTVVVQGELRDALLPHQLLQVGPDRVRALGEDPVPLVQHLVQDRHALVGQTHLVRVRVHQAPTDLDCVPVLADAVQLTADVLDRLADTGEQRFQPLEQGSRARGRRARGRGCGDGHRTRVRPRVPQTSLGRSAR